MGPSATDLERVREDLLEALVRRGEAEATALEVVRHAAHALARLEQPDLLDPRQKQLDGELLGGRVHQRDDDAARLG